VPHPNVALFDVRVGTLTLLPHTCNFKHRKVPNPAKRASLLGAHFSRMPPITACISTPLLLSIHAAMNSCPAQVLPV